MRRMDLPSYMSTIQQYKITETALVPAIVTAILKSSMEAYKLLRSLRTVWCAGAPLAQSTGNQMYRLLRPTARLLQVWGMTEAGWITTFLWPEKDHSGSVGRLLPGMEAKWVDFNPLDLLLDSVTRDSCNTPDSCTKGRQWWKTICERRYMYAGLCSCKAIWAMQKPQLRQRTAMAGSRQATWPTGTKGSSTLWIGRRCVHAYLSYFAYHSSGFAALDFSPVRSSWLEVLGG